MNKIFVYGAMALVTFMLLFLVVPALISAKSTVAVVCGFAIILIYVGLVVDFIIKTFKEKQNGNG